MQSLYFRTRGQPLQRSRRPRIKKEDGPEAKHNVGTYPAGRLASISGRNLRLSRATNDGSPNDTIRITRHPAQKHFALSRQSAVRFWGNCGISRENRYVATETSGLDEIAQSEYRSSPLSVGLQQKRNSLSHRIAPDLITDRRQDQFVRGNSINRQDRFTLLNARLISGATSDDIYD